MKKLAALLTFLILFAGCDNTPKLTFYPNPEYQITTTTTLPTHIQPTTSSQAIIIVTVATTPLQTTLSPSTTKVIIPPLVSSSTLTTSYVYIGGAKAVGGDGEPIQLINNPKATNPTYAELMDFLNKDQTDKYPYILGPPKNAYICGDFAETVHNSAEAAGIRAAWVALDIVGNSIGHAINAFETTDIGLVYIDCTGKGLWTDTPSGSGGLDRRARVKVGEAYSICNIGQTRSTTRFLFTTSVDYRKSGLSSADAVIWLSLNNVESLGNQWMQNWIQDNTSNLQKCGQALKPESYFHETSYFGSIGFLTDCRWRLPVDAVDVPWFQPKTKIDTLNGMQVNYTVTWEVYESSWLKPLGVVKDIYINW